MDEGVEEPFSCEVSALSEEKHANRRVRIHGHACVKPFACNLDKLRKEPCTRDVIVYREFAAHYRARELIGNLLYACMLDVLQRLLLGLADYATGLRPRCDRRLRKVKEGCLVET